MLQALSTLIIHIHSWGFNNSSSQNTFIERSEQFEEELMPELELALVEHSHHLHQDDVSDEFHYDIYDSDIAEYDEEYHGSPIRPKWV